MRTRILFLALLFLGSVALFGRTPDLWAAGLRQASTPTPAPEEEGHHHDEAATADEHTADEHAGAHAIDADHALTATMTLESLAARVAALEAEIAALAAPASGANEVATAVYLLDQVGLHDLDERLNGEGTIEAGDSGKVARAARLLSAVTWPAALATTAMSTTTTLNDLAAALADDDLEAAAAFAATAHEVAHELSHATEHWLGALPAGVANDGGAGQIFRVTSAVYLLDKAGLHDLDVRLNEEQDLQASDAGNVQRIARLLHTVDWPEALATNAMRVTTVLDALGSALADDDLAVAAPLATQAHDAGHELSHAAEHWLSGLHGDHGDAMAAPAGAAGTDDGHDHAAEGEGEADGDDHGDDHSHSSGG